MPSAQVRACRRVRGLGFIRAGAVVIRIRKMPAVFFRILVREEKPRPRAEKVAQCD